MKLLFSILFGAIVGVVGPAGVAGDNQSTAIIAKITSSIPKPWIVVERRFDALPEGHYWGQSYGGVRGEEIVIQGDADVHVIWRDINGEWHTDAVGKEALRLYVMPLSYRESLLRFFVPKRPVAASFLFEGQAFKIYTYPSFRILDKGRLDRIVKKSTAIRWPDSPVKAQTLSWTTWRDDIVLALKGM